MHSGFGYKIKQFFGNLFVDEHDMEDVVLMRDALAHVGMLWLY